MIPGHLIRIRSLWLLLSFTLLAACGTFQVGIEPALEENSTIQMATATIPVQLEDTPPAVANTPLPPSPPPTQKPADSQGTEPVPTLVVVEATTAPAEPTPEPAVSPLWVTYRSAEHGFGLALPCYWVIDTFSGGLRTSSYDFLFAMANSIRSHWKDGLPPEGAFNPDIGTFAYSDHDIPPGTAVPDAVAQIIDDTIVDAEKVTLGSQTAWKLSLAREGHPDYFARTLYFFQLPGDLLLMFNPKWTNTLESADMASILASVSLSPDEPVQLPTVAPTGSVDGREIYLNQEAGYCFQYPSEFILEEFSSGQPGLTGPIVTLTLERPLYTVGLTIETQRIFGAISLEESVTRFVDQLSGDAAGAVQRNPVELVGGMPFLLGGQPAELLEAVPGPDGSRDIFTMNGNHLYHLIFSPSPMNNPQAAQDLHLIYNTIQTSLTFLPIDG